MHFKEHSAMKVFIVVFSLVLGYLYYLYGLKLLEVLADISSIAFFAFSTIIILCTSAIIAIDSINLSRFRTLENEYELLKDELSKHVTRSSYSITFSDEAILKHEQYKQIEEKIKVLQEEDYENI
jgi:hypothetical protein